MIKADKISLLLDEPESLVIADGINMVMAVLVRDENLIQAATENIIDGIMNKYYEKETVVKLSNFVHTAAEHFRP